MSREVDAGRPLAGLLRPPLPGRRLLDLRPDCWWMMAIPPAYQDVVFSSNTDTKSGGGWRSTLTSGELTIHGDRLLSAIWYSDGSGAHGISSGLDSIPDDWRITNVRLVNGFVKLSIERKNLE